MDDFFLLSKTKKECKLLKEKLHLELNEKSRYYPNKMGINFCGYRIYETHILLRNNSKKKIKKRIKYWNKQYKNKKSNIQQMKKSLNSWLDMPNMLTAII